MFDALARLMNPGYTQLAPQDAARRSDLTIVDVRERDELKGELGHIPGAQHLSLQRLLAAGPAHDWTPETPLLLVCRSGARSASAAAHLPRQGLTQLFNLRAGILARTTPAPPVSRNAPHQPPPRAARRALGAAPRRDCLVVNMRDHFVDPSRDRGHVRFLHTP